MSETLLNRIYLCEVAKVHDYGAFARIPDCKQQGLIHRSQVSATRVDDVTEVLQQGERLWCKIISINDGKIALSMKVVDQGSGKDLDPNGVQIYLDEQKKKKGPDYNKKKSIELGAVFNTVCAKCGTRGHLSKDCFKGADGKTYELLPEDDTEDIVLQTEPSKEIKNEKKENKRKRKKEKEEKHSIAKKKKRENEKKPKKSKKRKRTVSTSSSSTSSSSSSSSSDSTSDLSDHRSKHKRKRKKTKLKSKKKSKR